MEQGWAQLVLPTKAEAAEYFARFRQAPPDADALRPGVVEIDEDVVEGMIDETHRIMQSARFSVAVLVSTADTSFRFWRLLSLRGLRLHLAEHTCANKGFLKYPSEDLCHMSGTLHRSSIPGRKFRPF